MRLDLFDPCFGALAVQGFGHHLFAWLRLKMENVGVIDQPLFLVSGCNLPHP